MPTTIGVGERRHLLSAAVALETFIADLVNLRACEAIEEAVLVGHSFGVIAITGTTDHEPERIRQLVYLDNVVLDHGEAPRDVLVPTVVEQRIRLARELSGGLGIPPPGPIAFAARAARMASAWPGE